MIRKSIRMLVMYSLVLAFCLAIVVTERAAAQTLTVLHDFTGGADGGNSWVGLTMDRVGNLYGATLEGGLPGGCGGRGCGVIYKMTHRGSGWVFAPLYTFTGGLDGAKPVARVIIGPDGTLFGSTIIGGPGGYQNGTGVIYNLRPPAHISGRVFEPWTETVLYSFGGVMDGNWPSGDLVFDPAGNIFGTTQSGGYECQDTVYCGTVFELARNGTAWTESLLYIFTNGIMFSPMAGLIRDQAGNLYGTTAEGAGGVFQLTYSGSSWTETTIHLFGGQDEGYSASA
jgi:hypothetical protein